MLSFVKQPNKTWAYKNIDSVMATFRLDRVWVLDTQMKQIYQSSSEKKIAFPCTIQEIQEWIGRTRFLHGYIWTPEGLLELRAAPIQPSSDLTRQTPPQGWLIACRLWSPDVVSQFELITGLKLSLSPQAQTVSPSSEPSLHLTLPLLSPSGKPAGVLEALVEIPILIFAIHQSEKSLWCLGIGLTSLFLLTLGSLLTVFLAPLRHCLTSATDPQIQQDPSWISRDDELGSLARLIQRDTDQISAMSASTQRAEQTEKLLRDSLHERDLFARDLHDDTLQSLYAIGMSLETTTKSSTPDSPDLRKKIQSLIPEINRSIASLRVAIAGLESGPPDAKRLAALLRRIAESSAGAAGIQVSTSIQDEAAAYLDRVQSFHIMHIARELCSNTMRHSQTTQFTLTLQLHDDLFCLETQDDGKPTSSDGSSAGHGWKNIQSRATELGGEATVHTDGPGRRVTVTFPRLRPHN